jgi:membrane protein
VRHAVARLAGTGRELLQRFAQLEIIDRSLVVGAQAFGALVPLLIVLASLGARGGQSFADSVIKRFGLTGDGAEAIRRTFTAPADNGTITIFGVLLVVFSSLSFARALQRTYEKAWDLPRLGMKGTGWGLLWIAIIAAYWTAIPVADDHLGPFLAAASALAGSFALWLITPYLLLARRLSWWALIPQAALSALGMTALGLGALLYAPRAIDQSATEFGVIGVAFTLLSLLWAGGFVLVTAAAIGASITLPPWRGVSRGPVTPSSSSTSAARDTRDAARPSSR